MKKIKKIITLLTTLQLLTSSVAFAVENEPSTEQKKNQELNLQEVTLPSEVKDMLKNSGAIYYNSSVKNKVLIPSNFWGEVNRPGLHFIPTDSTLIKALSMAGGPSGAGKLENVSLTRNLTDGTVKKFSFNLENGGDNNAYTFKVEPGDSVFIPRDQFREDRAYYTGLISIGISILSTFVLFQKIK